MFRRSTIVLVLLGAIGLPYVVSNGGRISQAVTKAGSHLGLTEAPEANASAAGEQTVEQNAALPGGVGPATGALMPTVEVQPLPTVFRWDVTTAWVLANWKRVSTNLADIDLKGYRVALVSGTSEGDVAGSLTYYFNSHQRVQRIVFQGITGDARPLVHLMATQHQFTRQITPDPGEYLYKLSERGKVIGELRITVSPIVRQETSRERFSVSLRMDRPSKL